MKMNVCGIEDHWMEHRIKTLIVSILLVLSKINGKLKQARVFVVRFDFYRVVIYLRGKLTKLKK